MGRKLKSRTLRVLMNGDFVGEWNLTAVGSHEFVRGGSYHLTPLYDVLSAYPVMGNGPKMLSSHKARMAMGLWGKNKHYLWRNMQKQHLLTTGIACGLSESVCVDIIDDMIGKRLDVIDLVSAQLPAGFPAQVADAIFEGVWLKAKMLV